VVLDKHTPNEAPDSGNMDTSMVHSSTKRRGLVMNAAIEKMLGQWYTHHSLVMMATVKEVMILVKLLNTRQWEMIDYEGLVMN
jgi:hypothetical protein